MGTLASVVKDRCGGHYGFYSAHAANTMALAVFIGLTLIHKYRNAIFILLFWAALVAYSRVYIGVHYPGDVIVGMIMGACIGWLFYSLSQKALQRWFPKVP